MPSLPEYIGKYRIESLVAKGGMGAVYKAVHPELKRYVIIKKLIIRGNATVTERFKHEAQILLDLNNPRIVHVYDYFREGAFHYIVLEFVDGLSLDKLIQKKKTFSAEMALWIVYETCQALKYAHEHGIVHRDIKPGNILVSRKGEVKLADFGIASSDQGDGDPLGGAGETLGTPSYMPPEQFKDSASVDKRADIYAVGVMLYEMVTGAKPFPGAYNNETVARIKKGKYLSARKLVPGLPRIIDTLLKKMIRPNPRKRYQNMEPIIRKIKKYLSRYPIHDIRIALVENLLTSKTDEPIFLPRKRPLLRAFLIFICTLGIVLGSYIAWNAGLIHRYFLRNWYTPVTVSVKLPPTATAAGPDSLLCRAYFFVNDGNSIPEVPGTRRDPLSSRAVFLRPGNYRIKVVAGPRIWWQSIAVGQKEQSVEFDFTKEAPRILGVKTSVVDAETGRDITSSARISVLYDGKWVLLNDLNPNWLVSGTVWKIRAAADGYGTEIFSLRIEWYQDELVLNAALIPLSNDQKGKKTATKN